jgi:type II secretory pathway component PulJ
MECKQLIRLSKDWYTRVEQETMAPARMMEFMDNHIRQCSACQLEEGLEAEIEKIREFVLPESKIPKAVRAKKKQSTPEISSDEHDDASLEVNIDPET